MRTPGPWPAPEYDNHGNGGFSEWWEVGAIATVHTSEDDARLIHAAPDLLAALKRLVNDSMSKNHPDASQMAIDAIRKAEPDYAVQSGEQP